MTVDDIIIAGFARTPMGGFQGALAAVSAVDLGATAVAAAVERSGFAPSAVERIYMGCVLPAALGQAPARQVALAAGLPENVEATTVNKMCGSGMQAMIMAAEALRCGSVDVVVAGGMESMTNAPYALAKHRAGARIGHDRVIDTMMMDGLEDAYQRGKPMGAFAEDTAREYQFTRDEMDAYAIESLRRANAAIMDGAFAEEIAPVTVKGRRGETIVAEDEQPAKADGAKIPRLKAAFADGGHITAASSASISDGAAAMVLTRRAVAHRLDAAGVARVVASAAHAHAPALFTTAPVFAIRKVLEKAGWSIDDVDLFEVNEAFAAVAMIVMRDLGVAHDLLNIHGGATALGHPIGASGARIVATLISALRRRGKTRGIAALCIGGGEATAMAVELL
jgi:acetyl-CoA C-acetyltransferase